MDARWVPALAPTEDDELPVEEEDEDDEDAWRWRSKRRRAMMMTTGRSITKWLVILWCSGASAFERGHFLRRASVSPGQCGSKVDAASGPVPLAVFRLQLK